MSVVYWLVALALLAVAMRPVRARLLPGRGAAGRAEADDPLIDWVVELRAAGRQVDGDGPGDLRRGQRYRTGVEWPTATGTPGPAGVAGGSLPALPKPPAVSGPAASALPGAAPLPTLPAVSRPPGWRSSRGPTGATLPGGAPLTGSATATGLGWWAARPRRTLLLTALFGAGIGLLLAGPVAAFALAGYGSLGVRGLLRRATALRVARARRERLDQLCALAADLRVGLPVPVAAEVLRLGGVASSVDCAPGQAVAVAMDGDGGGGAVSAGGSAGAAIPVDRPGRLARAAIRLADRTGAPLAELVERIESDARSAERGLAAAAAQGAGARATAWLLAALPLGGIGLGYGIGVDPLQVLLHTPVGGGCAIAAVILQAIGLLWAERLAAVPGGEN
ncbi:hypothetical protein [Micromonospora sp. LOL_024]|uniref:type II secretion system F family protein n=1 Tax=Micromonospora sp. LOL_024 TaxID=3345412 RepID=UPI003A8B98CF